MSEEVTVKIDPEDMTTLNRLHDVIAEHSSLLERFLAECVPLSEFREWQQKVEDQAGRVKHV